MNEASEKLAALVGGHRLTSVRGTVTAYREDGRINVRVNGAQMTKVPCVLSYTGRTVGDTVELIQYAGRWLCLGRTGADSAFTGPTVQDLATGQYRQDQHTSIGQGDLSVDGTQSPPVELAIGYYNGTSNVMNTAASGKTNGWLTLARIATPHGDPGPSTIQVVPHNHNALPATVVPATGFTQLQTQLELGEIRNVALPSDWVTAIKAATPTIKGFILQPISGSLSRLSATSGGVRFV